MIRADMRCPTSTPASKPASTPASVPETSRRARWLPAAPLPPRPPLSRWRLAWVMAAGFVLILVGSSLAGVVAVALTPGARAVPGDALDHVMKHPWPGFAAGLAAQAVVGILGYLAIVRWIERRPATDLRGPGALRELLAGLTMGSGHVALAVPAIAAIGGWRILGSGTATGVALAVAMGVGAACLEEVTMRGLLLRHLDARAGPWLAIPIVSVVFAALHWANAEGQWWPLAAIAIEAGLVLNAAWYLTRRLWVVMGLHAGWNATLAGVFGIPVSGFATDGGLLRSRLEGPAWLTGGSFGPEASVVTVALGIPIGLLLLAWARRRGAFDASRRAG